MYSLVYEILSIVGLAVVLEVGLAIWVGNRLAEIARPPEEAASEPVLDFLAKKPTQ
jgi:hypothetical protein